MRNYLLIVFSCFTILNATAQDNDLVYGQYLLDSVRQLPPMDTADYSIDELLEINNDYSIMSATVYYDCNGDDCFEARKGLITSSNDTIPLVFDDIRLLKDDELVLMGLQKVIHIGAGLNVIKVYDDFGPMLEQLAVFIENGLYGLFNEAGEMLLAPVYTYIENNEDNAVILTRKENEWKALDKDALLNRAKEDEFDDWELQNSLLKVQNPKSHLWAFFSREVKQLTLYKYEDIQFTDNGDAKVSIDNYWGMVNNKGEESTEIKYDEILNGMGATYIAVQGVLSEQYGLVNVEGQLTPIKYSKITPRPLYSYISKVYYWVAKETKGNWGLLKLQGQPLTAFMYKEIDLKNPNSPKGLINGKWVELIE